VQKWSPGRALAEGEDQMIYVGKNRWTQTEDEHLRKLARSGLSPADIATQMNRSKPSICRRALRINIAIAHDRNPMQKPLVESGLKAKGK
jgi:hypothetical protein